jgi:short-subunit dehydrogenase
MSFISSTKIAVASLSAIGATFVLYSTIRLALFSWVYLRPSSMPRYLRPEGAYALVTGASDGVGLGCAEELLSRGFNVILHGRNADKLSNVQKRLKSEFPSREVEVFLCDASSHGLSETISKFVETLKGKPLTVLVNNVMGMPYTPMFKKFESNTPGDLDVIMNICARFQVQITHALLPILSANQPSLIMTMGSLVALTSAPCAAAYGACKSSNLTFSRSLRLEMELLGKDIEVLGLHVAGVRKEKQASFIADLLMPTTRPFAKAAFNRVGCGKSVVWAWMPHAVVGWIAVNLVPDRTLKGVFQKQLEPEKLEEEKKDK